MNRTIDTLIKTAMAGLLIALGYIIVTSMTEHVVDVGDNAPPFTITTDKGARMSVSQFGGRVLVLNFWAAWCQPCVDETPSLDEFQRTMADSGVVVLGISVDKNLKLYDAFVKRFNLSFQTARDPEANISSEYGTFKYPETYIIDKSGKVVQKIVGPRNWNDPQLMNFIKSI